MKKIEINVRDGNIYGEKGEHIGYALANIPDREYSNVSEIDGTFYSRHDVIIGYKYKINSNTEVKEWFISPIAEEIYLTNDEFIFSLDGELVGMLAYARSSQDVNNMKAEDILEEAAKTLKQRGKDYDKDEERSAAQVAQAFNAITKKELTTEDIWLVLELVKKVRQYHSDEPHLDSALDAVAYAALFAEEIYNKEEK